MIYYIILIACSDVLSCNLGYTKINMKIYTKFGDSGETVLYGGTRLGKDALQFEAIGTVDELNAYIGYAQTLIDDPDLSELLARVQNHLFYRRGGFGNAYDTYKIL